VVVGCTGWSIVMGASGHWLNDQLMMFAALRERARRSGEADIGRGAAGKVELFGNVDRGLQDQGTVEVQRSSCCSLLCNLPAADS